MSKFESKPPGQRNWLIWKSIYSVKESYYWSLIAFAFMTVMTIVVDYSVTNDTGLSIEQDGNEFAIIWLTLVPIMIFMFFVMNLAYYVEGIRFSKKHAWQYLAITAQGITLQRIDGLEININQGDILNIFMLRMDETKELIERRFRPVWNKIELDVLKIKTKREDYCIILDIYNDAKQIVNELNNLYPIDGLDEYMRK